MHAQQTVMLEASRFQRQAMVVGLGSLPTCLDTYLSPNVYSGLSADVGLEQWSRSPWGDGRLFVQTYSHTTLGLAACSATSSELLAMEDWTLAYPWQCLSTNRVRLYAGAEFQARLGGIWNPRNSNNPANLKAALHLGGMVMAETRYRLGRLPVRTALSFDMPLLGTFFSPDYTQSYYELFYVGNNTPTLHLATPVGCLSGRGRVDTDITFSSSIFRLSLMEDYYRWHTATQRYALHTLSLGVGLVFNSYQIHPHENAASILPY